ncbi:hypothetical protein BOTBODRAFT_143138 [Botryobasidium botryosum FD-172 SS1]|uniref:NADPH:adrenodoxin oxidoreductase, mitochondrial n=1 Tax=Botryobasidium botryosum (strain FD-172 SS1) TaxID=930990 RepID=A0A067N4T8_BOTB1|nr:hypothetical protein BOTBODRAFT_143138 [Botryobasidium botryosum FD-172 SS1]
MPSDYIYSVNLNLSDSSFKFKSQRAEDLPTLRGKKARGLSASESQGVRVLVNETVLVDLIVADGGPGEKSGPQPAAAARSGYRARAVGFIHHDPHPSSPNPGMSLPRIKLAIAGGGPSAFYSASRVLSRLPRGTPQGDQLEVHIFDRLWAPHGLVRYGVAPDHPEVKNCTHKFDVTALDPRFRFFGNVSISDAPSYPHNVAMPLKDITQNYSHLLFATGSPRPLALPALPDAIPALSLVQWYTAHPSRPTNPPPLSDISHLTIIGHGNVSLDIARLLLSPPSSLTHLDLPRPVLDVLRASSLKHINIVSRRGPAEVAFTAKELREMLSLPNAALEPIPPELLAPTTTEKLTRQQSRILDLLRKGSKATPGSTPRSWSLQFLRTPHSMSPGFITFAHNILDADRRARPTGTLETQPTDLVVSSVGYCSEPLTDEVGKNWFDFALGRVRNEEGRVMDVLGNVVPGVYTAGWAAHGAKGVLASTLNSAYSVTDMMIADTLESRIGGGGPMNPSPPPGIPPLISSAGGQVIRYRDWRKVNEEEVRRGQALGKERERMGWDDVMSFLGKERS